MEGASDQTLLAAWQAGDAEAGEELFGRHFEAVYRFFRTKIGEGVDDLVHQTFLRGVESARRFEGRGSFRSFLLGIARHQLYNALRKKQRERKALAMNFMSIEHIMGSPQTGHQLQERRDVLLAALRKLPLDLQIAVELSYWEDLSLAEMADILEIPVGTAKSRLFRARTLLREAIESLEATPTVRQETLANLDATAKQLRASLLEGRSKDDP